MKTLAGKVAVVTGAASGIGRATAELLAERGMKVVLGTPRMRRDRLASAAAGAEHVVLGDRGSALAAKGHPTT